MGRADDAGVDARTFGDGCEPRLRMHFPVWSRPAASAGDSVPQLAICTRFASDSHPISPRVAGGSS
jgi:hypothetical protein